MNPSSEPNQSNELEPSARHSRIAELLSGRMWREFLINETSLLVAISEDPGHAFEARIDSEPTGSSLFSVDHLGVIVFSMDNGIPPSTQNLDVFLIQASSANESKDSVRRVTSHAGTIEALLMDLGRTSRSAGTPMFLKGGDDKQKSG